MNKGKWDKKWKNNKNEKPNNFAKRVFLFIKNRKIKTILDLGSGVGGDAIFFSEKG